MVAENYACAYREVIEILKYTNQDDVNKIPSEKLLLWLDNMKEDYNFEIDEEKPLSEQNISKEAKAILANIFKEYFFPILFLLFFISVVFIEEKEKYDMEKLEKEKYEKYNPNDIFKNKNQINIETDNISDNVAMVEYKVSLFTKIFNKIKCIFKK